MNPTALGGSCSLSCLGMAKKGDTSMHAMQFCVISAGLPLPFFPLTFFFSYPVCLAVVPWPEAILNRECGRKLGGLQVYQENTWKECRQTHQSVFHKSSTSFKHYYILGLVR